MTAGDGVVCRGGRGLRLTVRYGTRKLYVLSGGFAPSRLDTFRRELASGDVVGVVAVDFALDKHRLAHQALEPTVVFQPAVLAVALFA